MEVDKGKMVLIIGIIQDQHPAVRQHTQVVQPVMGARIFEDLFASELAYRLGQVVRGSCQHPVEKWRSCGGINPVPRIAPRIQITFSHGLLRIGELRSA